MTDNGADDGWFTNMVRSEIAECQKRLGDPFTTSAVYSTAAATTFIKAVNDNKADHEDSPILNIGLCRWTVLLSRNKANSRQEAESAFHRLAARFSV